MGGSTKVVTNSSNTPDPSVTARASEIMDLVMGAYMPDGTVTYPDFVMARDWALGADEVAPLNAYHAAALETVGEMPGYESNYYNAQGYAAPNYYEGNLPVEQTRVGAFSADEVARFQSPHDQLVIDQGMEDLDKQFRKNLIDIGDSAAKGGAFGGSRQAILEGEASRNFGDAASRFVASQRQAGYDKALAARQAEIGNNLNIYNTGLQSNEAANAESQRALTNNLTLADQGNRLAAAQSNFQQSAGDMLRDTSQQYIDAAKNEFTTQFQFPLTVAGQLAAMNSGTQASFPSTSTSTQKSPSGLGSALLGTAMAALPIAFSDEDAKCDIRDDVDPEDALGAFAQLDVPSWRYDDEAQEELGVDDRRHVGPMAQDVEEHLGAGGEPVRGYETIDVISMLGNITAAIKGLESRTRHLAPSRKAQDIEEAA